MVFHVRNSLRLRASMRDCGRNELRDWKVAPPNGQTVKRANGQTAICQCLAKMGRFCQTLAKSRKRAAGGFAKHRQKSRKFAKHWQNRLQARGWGMVEGKAFCTGFPLNMPRI